MNERKVTPHPLACRCCGRSPHNLVMEIYIGVRGVRCMCRECIEEHGRRIPPTCSHRQHDLDQTTQTATSESKN